MSLLKNPSSLGLSLLECLVTLALITILTGLSWPYFHLAFMRQERHITLNLLEQSLEYARSEAIYHRMPVSLCPLPRFRKDQTCGEDWSDGFMIFLNPHERHHPENPNKDILQVLAHTALKYGRLRHNFNASRLTFSAKGHFTQNGTFTYCPQKLQASEVDGLIIAQGRARRSYMRDAQGILLKEEHAKITQQVPLLCP